MTKIINFNKYLIQKNWKILYQYNYINILYQ